MPLPVPEPPRETRTPIEQHERGAGLPIIPCPVPDGAVPEQAPTRPFARQEYSLLSLVELSRTLWASHDVHEVAARLLLNLMGQIGTAQAALWLSSEAGQPVLIRCHGIDAGLARAMVASCWVELSERFLRTGLPISPAEVRSDIGQSTRRLARQARVALFAPLCADDVPVGLVALGLPVGRTNYSSLELEVLEASLAVAGLAVRSAHLHSVAMETGRRLRHANAELRELDRMKSEFMDHVNHELRTPLTVVLGCLQCLAEPRLLQEERGPLLESATVSAEGLLRLVERLLTFSESSGGLLIVNLSQADLTAFVSGYYDERRPGVSVGLRELELDCDGERLLARFDALRLRQVVDELVDNAVKFSSPGTMIRLRLRGRVENDRAWVEISVEDQGVGIPADRLPHLFQAFHQLDGSMTRKAGGLGIGLAAARLLIEAMGGRITTESQEGRGSTFSVLLPAA